MDATPKLYAKVSPNQGAQLAEACEKRGEWAQAVAWWGSARAASIGHGRRQRYEDAQDCAREKAKAAGQEVTEWFALASWMA